MSEAARWRDHPLRARLLAEAHARPPAPLDTPMLATRLATLGAEASAGRDRAHMAALCAQLGHAPPAEAASWCALDAGDWQMRWERHTEFSTWTFFTPPRSTALLSEAALDRAPRDWLTALPGDVLVATALDVRPRAALGDPLARLPHDTVGARVADGAATVYTDFRAGPDGFTRVLLLTESDDPALNGRLVQSLLEIETYRLTALLAFPLAGEAGAEVGRIEREAAALAGELSGGSEPEKDRALLGRLAALAGEAEALSARTAFRFGAGRAYHEIVRERVAGLREERVATLLTLGNFMERRLAPAMRTCDSVAEREHAVIERIARTGELLNTRVQVAAEGASVALLASMDRRAKAQLRLQRTVEGLSVAAISYYAVGLLLYPLKALEKTRYGFDATLAAGLLAPLVVLVIWFLLSRLKASLERDED